MGTISHTAIDDTHAPPRRASRRSEAQARGLRYEAHVQKFLCGRFAAYARSPAVRWRDASGIRFAVPDGLLLDPVAKRLFIFEIKISHMPEAFWQLVGLYEPVLRVHCPSFRVFLVEIVKSFDPATPFPCGVHRIAGGTLHEWIATPQAKFGVFVWRGVPG